jgi:hypothetical protein
MRERRGVYRVLVGKPEKNNQLGDPDMDGSIVLKRIFMWDFGHRLDSSGSRQGQVVVSGESSKESQVVHKVGSFVDCLRTCQLLK